MQTQVGTGTTTSQGLASASTLTDFANLFTTSAIQATFPNYTEVSNADFTGLVRGIPVNLGYTLNSPALRFQVPGANIDVTFNGATRNQSQDLLLRWFRGEGSSGAQVTSFMQLGVATTPIDPIAGNPNSLMSQMASRDFGSATGIGLRPSAITTGRVGGSFEVGARYGASTAGAYDQNTYTLPISYRWGFQSGDAVVVDAPLNFSQTNGSATTYSGSLGIGYAWRVPLGIPALEWTLTPAIRLGAAGSYDLGGASGMWSVVMSSALTLSLSQISPGLSVTMGNSIGRLQTLPLQVGSYNQNYDLQNTSFRNGLMISKPIGEIFGRPAEVTVYAVDTRFSGSQLYINSFQEFGVYINAGTTTVAGIPLPLRLGVNYYSGSREYSGWGINAGLTF